MGEIANRLNYDIVEIQDAERKIPFFYHHTVNVEDKNFVTFRAPPDSENFSALDETHITLLVKIVNENGSELSETDKPFIDPMGAHALFSSCTVRFDGEIVSTMNYYPLTSKVSRWIGSGPNNRGMWYILDNSTTGTIGQSDATKILESVMSPLARRFKKSSYAFITMRLMSDVLMSARQLLPPNVEIIVEMRRSADPYAICSNATNPVVNYKIFMQYATLHVRRKPLKRSVINRPFSTLKHKAAMFFTKLETRTKTINSGYTSDMWLDALSGEQLPNSLYIAFISQKALYGDYNTISTYFEHAYVEQINARLHGQDILTTPLKSLFKQDEDGTVDEWGSNFGAPYYSLMCIIGAATNTQADVRLTPSEYINGNTLWCIELGKGGGKPNDRGDVLDIEVLIFHLF